MSSVTVLIITQVGDDHVIVENKSGTIYHSIAERSYTLDYEVFHRCHKTLNAFAYIVLFNNFLFAHNLQY